MAAVVSVALVDRVTHVAIVDSVFQLVNLIVEPILVAPIMVVVALVIVPLVILAQLMDNVSLLVLQVVGIKNVVVMVVVEVVVLVDQGLHVHQLDNVFIMRLVVQVVKQVIIYLNPRALFLRMWVERIWSVLIPPVNQIVKSVLQVLHTISLIPTTIMAATMASPTLSISLFGVHLRNNMNILLGKPMALVLLLEVIPLTLLRILCVKLRLIP